jgi:hypothetical protein
MAKRRKDNTMAKRRRQYNDKKMKPIQWPKDEETI